MNKKELLKLVDSLNLPLGEYYILSSGSLLLYGIRDEAGDLDLCVSEELFGKDLKERFHLSEADKNECGFYKISEKIEIVVNNKKDSKYKFEYDMVDGYPVQKLQSILESKKNSEREKDKIDVKNILKYLNEL
ncbi:MAG: hypothetical protein IJ217_01675 [Clostridia bacterium]|nr:hypothetical protein [Clostridia bacterium]